jgi:hypothetical protein
MSTFYAVFQDPAKGRLAVMALLGQGVPTDDISLVARGDRTAFGKAPTPEETGSRPMADATSFVNTANDPVIDEMSPQGSMSEMKYAAVESPIGGGISTGSPSDAGGTVDESDDSQWLAEDNLEPGVSASQGDREVHDLELAIDTGFPTKTMGLDGTSKSSVPAIEDLERSIDAIDIPGFGVVIGSGPLATAVLDYGDGDPSDDMPEMMKYFRDEGVPDETAHSYLDFLDKGQAILAVGLVPGEVESLLVEAVADEFGAFASATFDAPRY